MVMWEWTICSFAARFQDSKTALILHLVFGSSNLSRLHGLICGVKLRASICFMILVNIPCIYFLHSPGSSPSVWGYWWLCQKASQGRWLLSPMLHWAVFWCEVHEMVGLPPPSAFYCHFHWKPHLKYYKKPWINVLINAIMLPPFKG